MYLKTVYVTVGSTQFNGLIGAMKEEPTLRALQGRKCRKLIVQHGNSEPYTDAEIELISKKYGIQVEQYKFRPNLEDIREADLIIGHAGAGTCMSILNNQKYGLLVVNDKLMDNHQLELAGKLAAENYIYHCGVAEVPGRLATLDFGALRPFESEPKSMEKFVQAVNDLMSY